MRVRLPALLGEYAEGVAVVELEGATGREVLAALEARYPAVGRRVWNEQGVIRRHVHVFVDDLMMQDLDAPLPDGVELTILAAVSGGR